MLIVWAMVAARWRAHTFLNGCKKLQITQWMVGRKTVYCKSFSYCKHPEGLFIWNTFADFVSRLFQTPEIGLMDTLRYKLVSQGTLQVTEVDNAWFSHVFWYDSFHPQRLSYSCSFRTHQQKEPNTACISYCSMRQSPETAFCFLSVYLVDKSKHSSNNQKVMASFLRVNKVLQVNLQKEQQILRK